jgi:hypothetical protein
VEKVEIPEMENGDWSISRFEVSKEESRFSAFGYGSRLVPPGTYTKLTHKERGVIMSDTPAEMRDHREAVYRAKGSCLINGLGIGMVLRNVLTKPEVTDVTVIEISQEVIDMVSPYYKDHRVEIIHADAFTWKPPKGKRYGMVWHDIWDTITPDNLSEMTKLHRKYGSRCEWQGSWAKYECLRRR